MKLLGQGLAARWPGTWSRGWATFAGTLLLMGLYALPIVGGCWLVLVVWVAPGRGVTINDLGEGLPLTESS